MGLLASSNKKRKQETDYQVHWTRIGGGAETDNPSGTGYYLPAEWAEQSGIQLTWPHAGTDWREVLDEAIDCFVKIARVVAEKELVLIVTPEPESVKTTLGTAGANLQNIRFYPCATDDTWARDHGGITLLGENPPKVLDFRFNGWGGKFPSENDNRITRSLFRAGLLHGEREDHDGFVLEGGSIECDGKGNLLTTSRCLYGAPGRNGQYTKEEIEDYLKEALHVHRVLWLNHGGIAGDDTDGHIDTLARFAPDDTIVYVHCVDPQNPNYEELQLMEQELQQFRTENGLPYRLIPLPSPKTICDEKDGRILPATYANFLVINQAVLYPTYGQADYDRMARNALAKAFPGYEMIGIDCRVLIRQNGSLHCVTMQYPQGIIC